MQVRGLPRHVIRNACRASRLLAAKTTDIEAARRRDVLARWHGARRNGLAATAAAKAVGVPRANRYRWQRELEPRSRRPHRARQACHDPKLALAVEVLRKQYPMWGKDKLAPILWSQGFDCSVSKVGRVLKKLIARGVVQAVPALRKGSRHAPKKHQRLYAKRMPKDIKPATPGAIIQVDTVHINLAPGKLIRHFTGYCPVAKWTVAEARNRATAKAATLFLVKLQGEMPFPIQGHLEKWRLPSNHANLICDFVICGLGDDGTAGLF
jgi:putative transposase